MSHVYTLEENYEDIADAIREKLGVQTTYKPGEMAAAISSISGGGSGNWAEVLSGNSTALVDDEITALRNYALGVTGNVTGRGYLTTVSLPSVTRIGDYGFSYQTKLASAVFSPELSHIGSYAFSNCGKLTELYCKNVTDISQNAFYYCTSLREVIMPQSLRIPQYVCGFCSSLVKADFGSENNSTIGNGAFSGCDSLETLVIRKTNAVLTGRSTMFTSSSPIAQGTGYIYVPSALVDSYKAANYWSTYANQIRAIEDYSTDGTVDGDIIV